MLFGYIVRLSHLVVIGIALFALLGFEVLVGLRRIKFKGRTHQKVHRWVGLTALGIATVHGLMALAFVYGWGF
jgi:hypothetical protein